MDGRRQQILTEAALLFGRQGFERTSIRDIAAAVGMLAGSVYYYFPSKDALLVSVYEDAIDHMIAAVDMATQQYFDPWDRLEAAATAHLRMLLGGGSIAAVVAGSPAETSSVRLELIQQRDRYERVIRTLIDAIALPPDIEPASFRLALLGALNWTLTWFRPGHADGRSPDEIARSLFAVFRAGRS